MHVGRLCPLSSAPHHPGHQGSRSWDSFLPRVLPLPFRSSRVPRLLLMEYALLLQGRSLGMRPRRRNAAECFPEAGDGGVQAGRPKLIRPAAGCRAVLARASGWREQLTVTARTQVEREAEESEHKHRAQSYYPGKTASPGRRCRANIEGVQEVTSGRRHAGTTIRTRGLQREARSRARPFPAVPGCGQVTLRGESYRGTSCGTGGRWRRRTEYSQELIVEVQSVGETCRREYPPEVEREDTHGVEKSLVHVGHRHLSDLGELEDRTTARRTRTRMRLLSERRTQPATPPCHDPALPSLQQDRQRAGWHDCRLIRAEWWHPSSRRSALTGVY